MGSRERAIMIEVDGMEVAVPFPQELLTRTNEVIWKAEENKAIDLEKVLPKESVTTTIKRTRKPRGKK